MLIRFFRQFLTYVNVLTIGRIAIWWYMAVNRLSSHLAELTSNHTYINTAIMAARFVQNQLYGSDHLVRPLIDLKNCYVESQGLNFHSAIAFNGWSVLANVTYDNHWRDMCSRLYASVWHSYWLSLLQGNPDPDSCYQISDMDIVWWSCFYKRKWWIFSFILP
jgi:hypothetical protein